MKIGLAQINIKWEDKEFNKQKCLKFIKEAKKESVDFVLFPEMTLTGFSMNVDKIKQDNSEIVDWFKEIAIKMNVYIGFGYVEVVDKKGENKFSIVSPYGEQICKYTKIHPFSYGKESFYYRGGEKIVITDIKEFKVCPFICYDLRFPEIFQIASKTAGLITVSANWPQKRSEHWKTLLRARAIENQCYVAGINTVGIVGDNLYSGDSMIVDPNGNVLVHEWEKEKLITYKIEIGEVKKTRRNFTLKNDRKENLYIDLYEINSKINHKGNL
ncbi:carbon-nitrogen family hydrolase [Haloimpatiens sp. FM7330]|uniref:carbon-nitrogen family hydrolase n=1 Tax=Haloimpatiens sp. FM7330 TaxID=3298610 RepID=UPI0036258083